MKKLLISIATLILALGLSSSNAGGAIEHPKGKFLFGGTFGAFQQSNIGTAYGVLSSINNGLLPLGEKILVPTAYRFSWGVHIGYLFPNQNDIIASTFIFNGHDGGNISAGANQVVSVALIPAFFAVNLADSAESSYYYETKLYQIAFGHRFYFMNNVFMLHPFIGVGLARVRETQQTGYLGLDGTPQNSAVTYMVSQFNGLGPLVGLDLAWHIWSYFNFNGTIAWNGIIAKLKQSFDASVSNNQELYSVFGSSNQNVISMITLEAGLSANFQIKNQQLFVILGYRAVDILGGIGTMAFPDDMNASLMAVTNGDVAFKGPFIRFSVSI